MTSEKALVRAQASARYGISHLIEGAGMLASVCRMIDGDEEQGVAPMPLTEALRANFQFALLQSKDGVDKTIDFKEATDGFIEKCKVIIERVRDEKDQAELVLDEFKKMTLEYLEQNDNLPFAGFRGKIARQKNSQPALRLAFGDRVLTGEVIREHKIADRFIKTEIVETLDTDAVKEALKAGEDIPWAALDQGYHPRYRK